MKIIIIINDQEMYRYFDYLFYGNSEDEQGFYKHRLRKEWKKKNLTEPYGLINYNVSEMMGSKSLRFITIGMAGEILFVVYTERHMNIRLISARLATKKERRLYYGII